MEVVMMPYFRPACLALAVVVTAVPASAQNWVYEPETRAPAYQPRVYDRVYDRPYDRGYVPAYEGRAYAPPLAVTQPLALTPAQRTTIYRTIIPQGRGRGPIVKERIVTETGPS